jgi:hypothetical protein
MLNLLLPCLLLAISSPANSMNLFGLDPIGVNFCCGEDETLVVRRTNPDKRVAECVSNGGTGKGSSLEGKQVWVGGEADGEMKSLKLLEVKKPDCQRGLVLTTVRMNKTDQQQVTKRSTACEKRSSPLLSLSCPSGFLIQVTGAMYGRVQHDICRGNSQGLRGSCVAESSLSVVSERCNLRRSCSIEASNNNFGDPCFGIEKYLEVDYTCIPANAVPNKEENSTIPLFPFAHDEVRLQGGLTPSEGNVLVRGRSVCDDGWGQNEADVVCRSLGYRGGSATTNSRFGNAPGGDFGMDDVKCQGYEEKLTDCQYASYDDCDANEAAGVVCEDAGVLTSDGELLFTSVNEGDEESEKSLARLEAGDFCLVQGSSGYDYDELLALSCDACSEQATCSYAKKLFNEVDWRGHGEIQEKESPLFLTVQ